MTAPFVIDKLAALWEIIRRDNLFPYVVTLPGLLGSVDGKQRLDGMMADHDLEEALIYCSQSSNWIFYPDRDYMTFGVKAYCANEEVAVLVQMRFGS